MNHEIHPFDLDLSTLSDLRDIFESAQQIASKGGMRVEEIKHILTKILRLDPKGVHKILRRDILVLIERKVKWDEFTHILEEEGALREKILDLKLDDISIKRFKEVFKRFVRVKYGQLSENSNAMVDQLIKIRVKDKDYYVITFDDRDVYVYDQDFKLNNDMTAFMESVKIDKTVYEMFGVEHDRKVASRDEKQRAMKDKISRNWINTAKFSNTRARISTWRKVAEHQAIGEVDVLSGLLREQELERSSAADTSVQNTQRRNNPGDRSHYVSSLNSSVVYEDSRRGSAQEKSFDQHMERPKSSAADKLRKVLRFGGDTNSNNNSARKPAALNLSNPNPQPSQPIQKEDAQRRMSKLLAVNAFARPTKKTNDPTIQVKDKAKKPAEEPSKTFYPTRVPGEHYLDDAEKKGIHKYFELFKKMDSENASEYIGIINKKISNNDYSDANLLIRQIGRRVTSKSVNNGAKRSENKEKSIYDELGIKKFEPYFNEITIDKLKDKAELLKEEIQNVTVTIATGKFVSKVPPPKIVKPLYVLEQDETSTKMNRLDPIERLASLKKPIYVNLIKADDQRKLLALALINTELQVYSLMPEGQGVRFVEVFKNMIESLIVDVAFGYNETWEADYMAVVVQDKIIFYRLSKGIEGEYKPSGLFEVVKHTLPDPTKLVLCKGFPLVLVGNKGKIQYFDESQDYRYEFICEFEAKWDKSTMAITTCVISERTKILAVGNAAGHVANIDGMTKQMKAFFHKFQDLVVDLHVFEEQNQLLVVYKSKRIAILNIVTFDVLQLVRDEEIHRPHDRFTASFFDREKGMIIIGGSFLKGYQAKIDPTIELNKREIQMKDKFRVKSNATTKQLQEDIYVQYDQLRVRALFKVFHLERQNQILAIEESKVAKIYDPSSLVVVFSFVIKLDGELVAAEISRNEKKLVVANDAGMIQMIHLNSGEVFENFFSTKMSISVLKLLPESSLAAIVCSDNEGRLCFYYSKFRGKGDQRPHQFVLAHSKPVSAMDCSDDFLVTADEGNVVIMWTFGSFIPLSHMTLPTSNAVSQATLSYLNDQSPVKRRTVTENVKQPEPVNKPYPVEIVAFRQQNHLFLILQSNGALHLVRATDNTLLHTFRTLVGEFAHINLDYFDTSLMTVDENFIVRMFQITNEAPSPVSIHEEQNTNPGQSQGGSKLILDRRKTRWGKKDSEEQEETESEAMSPRKTRFGNPPEFVLKPSQIGATLPTPNPQASGGSTISGVLRRRGVYAAGRILKLSDNASDKGEYREWALSLVEQTDLRDIYEGNVEKLKCVKVVYTKYFSSFMTAFNYGDILLWNRKGKLKKRIKNIDCVKDAKRSESSSSDSSDSER